MRSYLEFESDIKVLEQELDKLKDPFGQEGITEVDTDKISEIEKEINEKLNNVYSKLNRWQKTLVSRHEERPKSSFIIDNLFTNFIKLAGDRHFGEDKSVLTGFASFEGRSVLVIGQEKGIDLNDRIKRNFGMMRPEGYRKCIRLMKLADKFNIPIISFIDTPGAYPGVGAEQRGQAEAIASSIECCMSVKVPIISIIIGEGGSGGAIALASANKVLMLENGIYSVISPEGCASILWRDPSKALEAADAMKLSAKDLLEIGIIDEIIPEPVGGAHRNKEEIVISIKKALVKSLEEMENLGREEIFSHRKSKFLKIGRKKGFVESTKDEDRLVIKESFYNALTRFISNNKAAVIAIFIAALVVISLFLF